MQIVDSDLLFLLPKSIETRLVGPQYAGHLGDQMLNMAELLNNHQTIHSCGSRVAHAIDIVSRKVDLGQS